MIQHLYLHIPFCHRICPYCSFYKHTAGGTDMGAFVQALLGELDIHLRSTQVQPTTIYLGGGTPTLLSRQHLAILLVGLRQRLDFSQLEELCLEINPKTMNREKADLLIEHGVTRGSLGVQAWDQPTLDVLGRDHSPNEAVETYEVLRAAGFPSVSLDLMFSIPGQSLKVWEEGLKQTISMQPDHISCYNLTYEEDTNFLSQLHRGDLDTDQDRDADHFGTAMQLLGATGYEHYEISNYARPGHRSKHNQSYWRGKDYLGLGPSAVSTHQRVRWKNISDTAGYIRLVNEGRLPAVESETLSDREWLIERVALELRTIDGMDRCRVDPSLAGVLDTLSGEGLIIADSQTVRLTDQGKALADQIAEMLLPD